MSICWSASFLPCDVSALKFIYNRQVPNQTTAESALGQAAVANAIVRTGRSNVCLGIPGKILESMNRRGCAWPRCSSAASCARPA